MKIRKIFAFVSALVLCIAFSVPALASNSHPMRVVDFADLLSVGEEAKLNSMLDEISERQNFDVAVVTVYSLNGKTPTEFADDYYDYNGYGMGANSDGIMLVVSMEYRDWAITTCGYGITAFTDAGQEYMADIFTDYLSDGKYAKAFECFAEMSDDFVTKAKEGRTYGVGNLPHKPLSPMMLLLSLGIGVLIAFVATGVMKSSLKTARPQPAANNYVRAGSLNITEERDIFLYNRIDKRPRPKGGSSSGGGSSTHRSSSGRSHGGSRGKF